MKKILLKAAAAGASLVPAIALAQATTYNIINLSTLLSAITNFINAVTPVLIAVSVFGIIIGVVLYFINLGNEDKKKEALQFIMWGVILLFLMISIYGLVNILLGTFSLNTNRPTAPQL